MGDLAVDSKKPWTGPGRDPRADTWDGIEEDEDADDGEETIIDRPGVSADYDLSL